MCLLDCSNVGSSVDRSCWVVFYIFPLLWIEFCVLWLVCSQYMLIGCVEELDA